MSFWEAPASAAGVGGMTSSGSTPPETPPETTGSCLVLGAEADGVGPSVLFTCGASGSGRQYLFGAAEGFSRLALECRQRPSSRLRVVFLVSFVPRAAGGLGGLLLRLCADGHQEVTIAGPPGVGTYVAGVRDFNRFRHPTVTTLRLVPQNVASSDFCQDDTAACDAAAESYRDDSVLVFPLFSESLDTTKNETGNNETCQVCDAVNEETAAMESDSECDSQDTDSAAAADDANVSTHGTPPAKRTKQAPRMKHTCTNPEAQTLNQDTQNPRVNPKTARAALGYAVGVRDVRNPKKISSLFLVFDCRDDKDATALAKHPTVRCCLADGGCVSPVTLNGGGYAGKHPTQHPRAAAVFHLTPRNVAARPAYDSARRVSPLRKNENEPCFEKQPTHVDCVVRGEVGFRAGARTLARLHAVDTNAFPISPALMAPYRVAVAAGTGVGKQGQEKEKASSYGAGAGVGSADGSLCAVVTLFSSGSEKNEFLPGVVDQHSFRQDELDVDAVITQVTTQLAAMERGDEPSRLEEESGEKNARIESGRNSSSTCPSILFLGTGSAEPSKYRGSSGILVKLPGAVKGYALLDCGEGTAGALIRFLGGNESKRVVDELKFIFVSHQHADHMGGICGVLAMRSVNRRKPPLVVIGPSSLQRWLRVAVKVGVIGGHAPGGWARHSPQHKKENDDDALLAATLSFVLSKTLHAHKNTGPFWIPPRQQPRQPPPPMYAGNALPFGAHQPPPPPPPMYVTPPGAHPPPPPLYTTHGFYPPYSRPPGGASPTPPPPPPTQTQRLVASLGLSKLETVPVEHCPEASAIIVASNAAAGAPGGSGFGADFSLCYSGDCRPSPRLAQSARGVHVFIHEATFGDGLGSHAVRKKHSTVSEALGVCADANAGVTILTHFSQRYPKAVVVESKEGVDEMSDGKGIDAKGMRAALTDTIPQTHPPVIAFDGMRVSWDALGSLRTTARRVNEMFVAVDAARAGEGLDDGLVKYN